jgi:predicted N-acyltransferase
MTTTTEIFETIDSLDPAEWDGLVKGHPFANRRWLQVTESVLVGHQPRYVLLRRDGHLRAGAVCSIHNRFESRALQSVLGWLPQRFPVLRCGVPISYDRGLFFSDQEQAGKLLPELLNSVQTLLRQEKASFHSFDYLSPADPAWLFLRAQGYHKVDHLTEANLDIQWTSFEDYVRNLPRKKRSEYVRMRGHIEREGITIGVVIHWLKI